MNLEKYNQERDIQTGKSCYKFSPCIAPFNNMYFAVRGQVSPCWLSSGFLDKWSKEKSVRDIWFGEKFRQYRDNLKNNVFEDQCKLCKSDIDNGIWPLALAYDNFSIDVEYPTIMELELSNQCNLECLMCSGILSSGIRKNREKLPPLEQLYDDSFVEQLNEFIPYLEELRFNGGEPLLQNIVHKICENVVKINPNLKINIATNGTVYNKKVQRLLDNNNIWFNVSMDGFTKETYEKIRINANYETLIKNFKIFLEYSETHNKKISIMVNPMRNNWWEMHLAAEFCEMYDTNLWYNTIRYPEHLSLWNLDEDTLQEIYDNMKIKLSSMDKFSNTYSKYEHLVEKQIKTWITCTQQNIKT